MSNSNKKSTKVLDFKNKKQLESRKDKLKAIQAAIENGTYKIPLDILAEEILAKEGKKLISQKRKSKIKDNVTIASTELKILK